MWSASNVCDRIKGADVVVSTNHVTFLTNRFPGLISLPTSTIFVSSGIMAILKYRSINPISLSDRKSPQISRTLLSILADFKVAVVWMVLILPLIFNFSCLLSKPLEFQGQLLSLSPSCSTAFSDLWQDPSICLSFRLISFLPWGPLEQQNPLYYKFLFFFHDN